VQLDYSGFFKTKALEWDDYFVCVFLGSTELLIGFLPPFAGPAIRSCWCDCLGDTIERMVGVVLFWLYDRYDEIFEDNAVIFKSVATHMSGNVMSQVSFVGPDQVAKSPSGRTKSRASSQKKNATEIKSLGETADNTALVDGPTAINDEAPDNV